MRRPRRHKKPESNKKLPKAQLLVVALIFGIIGCYFIIRSFAAEPARVLYVNNSANAGCSDNRSLEQITQTAPLCSVSKALDLSVGGETINVAPGTYGSVRLIRTLSSMVTIRGAGTTKPIIMGTPELYNGESVSVAGGSNLTVENISLQGGRAQLTSHPTRKAGQVSQNITFRNDEFTNTGNGLTIRDGSRNVTVENCYFHDIHSGLTGPNYRIIGGVDNGSPNVNGVVVRNNVFERFKEDAMQFADWDNVTIDNNVMEHAQHDPPPAEAYHNDLIQFTGFSDHVIITNNYLNDSTQEIFIQPAFGPINDVLVRNNVLNNGRAYAIQSQGSTKVQFINNVVWNSKYGTILRSAEGYGYPAAQDTIVANNIFDHFSGKGAFEDYNLVQIRNTNLTYGAHDLVGADPKFVNSAITSTTSEDFRLQTGSPAINAGTSQFASLVDKIGHARSGSPDMGAYEYDSGEPPASGGTSDKKGDLTGSSGSPDGTIDLLDISYLIRHYNTTDSKSDVSGPSGTPDGKVDIYDLSYMIRNYGK